MILNTLLILIAIATTVIVMVARDWRWLIFGLTMSYIIGFVLIVQIWPLPLATVKLLSGLMGVVILSMSKVNLERQNDTEEPLSSRIFVFLLACLSWVIVSSTINKLNEWLPVSYTNLYIGLVISLAGILKFSIHQTTYEIIIGLLVFLAGFDIIYSSLEGSALVTGIYALIVLLICVLGSYLEGGFGKGFSE